jgi:hypothetical protein
MSQGYIVDYDVDRLVSHVTSAGAGMSEFNVGSVWCSGTNVIPSGYMDFKNVTFTNKFGATLVSGIIPTAQYSMFFVAEDTLGHRTGVDLIHYSDLGSAGILPSGDSFNY